MADRTDAVRLALEDWMGQHPVIRGGWLTWSLAVDDGDVVATFYDDDLTDDLSGDRHCCGQCRLPLSDSAMFEKLDAYVRGLRRHAC